MGKFAIIDNKELCAQTVEAVPAWGPVLWSQEHQVGLYVDSGKNGCRSYCQSRYWL